MQDWDRVVTILIGGGVAVYTGYDGWKLWRMQKRGAAAGMVLLGIGTAALPILLAVGSK